MTDTAPFSDKQWGSIPQYMRGGIVRYIQHGIEPGSFLSAVLCNDLRGACEAADDTNRHLLFAYIQFLYCHAPAGCWGSPERFEGWMDEHAEAREANSQFGVGGLT